MMLHIDGSDHAWFQDERRHELIVILDDATSGDLLCPARGSRVDSYGHGSAAGSHRDQGPVLLVVQRPGRAFFFVTPRRGERVDAGRPTQVGRALQELGIKMIPAYSPQARGRMERSYATWQGRLPQELRLHGIRDLERANEFLRCAYIAEFNAKFAVAAAQKGSAFVRARRPDLDWIISVQHERTVNQDNTISVDNRVFQLEKTRWRNTLAGQTVVVHEHLDGRVSIRYGRM